MALLAGAVSKNRKDNTKLRAVSLSLKNYVCVNYLYGLVIDIGFIATITMHIITPFDYRFFIISYLFCVCK